MKVDIDKEFKKHSLLGHAMLSYKSDGDCTKVLENSSPENGAGVFDVVLTVNGVETDLNGFFDNIQSQMDRMVDEKAKELVEPKIEELDAFLALIKENLLLKFDLKSDREVNYNFAEGM